MIIDLADARAHLDILESAGVQDDSLIESYIAAASDFVARYIRVNVAEVYGETPPEALKQSVRFLVKQYFDGGRMGIGDDEAMPVAVKAMLADFRSFA